nr:histidine kinase [Knoellia sp. DB2414S]
MSVLAFTSAVVQVTTFNIAYLADAAYPLLFFTLGGHRAPTVRRFGLVAAVVATVVGGLFPALVQDAPQRSIFETVAVCAGLAALTAVFTAGGWVAGYLRWQRRQAVQARVDAQLEAAERRRLGELYDVEQERRRIAADMHDVVAHSWAVVAAQSDGARYALRQDPAAAERALEVIGDTARTAITDLRTIVAQLRDPALAPTTPGYAQQQEVIDRMRASGMDLQARETGTRDESPLVALTAHRLLAESLTNALKHGDLSEPVVLTQDWDDGYRLTVTNRVSATPATDGDTGHGLVGMAERTTVAGGTFEAGREGDVWAVRVHLPTAGGSS